MSDDGQPALDLETQFTIQVGALARAVAQLRWTMQHGWSGSPAMTGDIEDAEALDIPALRNLLAEAALQLIPREDLREAYLDALDAAAIAARDAEPMLWSMWAPMDGQPGVWGSITFAGDITGQQGMRTTDLDSIADLTSRVGRACVQVGIAASLVPRPSGYSRLLDLDEIAKRARGEE